MTILSRKKSGKGKASAGGTSRKAQTSEERLFHVILAPHVSEKATQMADKNKQMVFEVRRDASKPVIKQAVEKMFNVQVESVTVTNVKGKSKQTGRISGRQRDRKKAYVRLKPGQDIDYLGQQ